jgi:hypothetical protein
LQFQPRSSLKGIEVDGFKNCTLLTETVIIPEGFVYFGPTAFDGCTAPGLTLKYFANPSLEIFPNAFRGLVNPVVVL